MPRLIVFGLCEALKDVYTMWEQVVFPWRVAIEQAWVAYCAGSLPIGAAILSPEGQAVTAGRNRLYDTAADGDPQQLRQHFMGHAEQNAFISLGILNREQPKPKKILAEYTLYTTLEPCDMCVGTLIQSGLKHIHFLLPDPVGGAIDSLRLLPHVRQKGILINGPETGSTANIVMALFTVTMAKAGIPIPDEIASSLHVYADGFALGQLLFQSHELESFSEQQMPVSMLYNMLFERLQALPASGLGSSSGK
jgi:tRNA(adenine34) deaminase